jgi:hypothetical protein
LPFALFAFAGALTTQVDPVYDALGRLTNVPNVGSPSGHVLILFGAWAGTALLLHSSHPPQAAAERARRRLIAVSGVALVLVGLFAAAPDTGKAIARSKPELYGRHGAVAAYYLIFVLTLGLLSADTGRLCWRYGRVANRERTRLGLQLIAASAVAALLYVANRAAHVISDFAGLGLPLGGEQTVSRIVIVIGTLLILAGTTVSLWGARLDVQRLYAWSRAWRSYRALLPLWAALYEVTPEIALYPPKRGPSHRFPVRDLDFRLHRCVVEIRDGLLALRPYVEQGFLDYGRRAAANLGLRADDADVHAHAVAIANAIDAKARGRRAVARGRLPGADTTGRDELADLRRLADEFRRVSRVTHGVERKARVVVAPFR